MDMENVMKLSWTIQRNAESPLTRGESLSLAHKAHKVLVDLSNGIAFFAYRKKDGSYRQTHGTTNSALIPSSKPFYGAKGNTNAKPKPLLKSYYDTDAEGWRSFYLTEII